MSDNIFQVYDVGDWKDRTRLLSDLDQTIATEKPCTNTFQALHEHHEQTKVRNAKLSKAIMEARRCNRL